MDRLPLEIYNQITSYLSFNEKRKLLLVCRYWHNTIKNDNLFNNFGIKGHLKFKAAALFFNENKLHRKQVRNLRLTKPEADLDYILAVPERFPWIQDFVWANYGVNEEETAIDEEQVKHWNHLLSFGEVNRYPLSTKILKYGGFGSLTKLTVSFHFSGASCSSLVQQLTNAPKLKHIDFASPNMTLADLEQLHLNTPQLEILYLSGVVQEENDDNFPERHRSEVASIADRLTTLWMRNMKFSSGGFGLTSAWMSYMAAKYRHLNCLTIDGVGMMRGRQDYYESRLTDIAAGCPHITSYKVNLFPVTPMILSAMDSNHIKLKRVDLTGDPTENQIQHLLHSQQCQSLETMILDTTQLSPNLLFNALEGFAKLKHVEIGYKHRESVSLDVVLQKLRYLETLKLSAWHIWLDKHAVDSVQTRLKSLVLENSDIDNTDADVMSFLASACPDLSRLSIQGQVQDSNRVFRVEFPHHYFTTIKLDIFGTEYYRVDNQCQTTWYRFSGRKLVQSHPDDQDIPKDQPHVSIVYQGSASLNIGGTDIPNW